MDNEGRTLAEIRLIVERHEERLTRLEAEVKQTVTNMMSDQTARLDETEKKLDQLVNETAGQSVVLEEIKAQLCAHKDQQAADLRGHVEQLGKNSGILSKQAGLIAELVQAKSSNANEVGKIKTELADLGVILRGDPEEAAKGHPGGVAGDLALVKKAVVHKPAQIGAMRAYRALMAVAAIVVCLTIAARPETIPLLVKYLESHSSR